MAYLFFPDNTALVKFGHINRYDVLKALTNGQGRWCGTVAQECAKSANTPGLSAMSAAPDIFGEPERPEGAEHLNTRILRSQMAEPFDAEHKHLGEAETITIITSRGWANQSIFVTDDKGAARFARADGITVIDTWYLIKLAYRSNLLTEAEVWSDVQLLDSRNEGWPPCGRTHQAVREWLDA